MDSPIVQSVLAKLVSDLFDVRIMGNVYRADYVERMIVIGLGDGFHLTSADWSGWDIEGNDGLRLEVKQSAARQTWTDRASFAGRPTVGAFDIAPRTGHYSDGGSKWTSEPGRPAEIYILAWHPVTDEEKADHRDPDQWQFFVVPNKELPPGQKTISRTVVERKWSPVAYGELRKAVLEAKASLRRA